MFNITWVLVTELGTLDKPASKLDIEAPNDAAIKNHAPIITPYIRLGAIWVTIATPKALTNSSPKA